MKNMSFAKLMRTHVRWILAGESVRRPPRASNFASIPFWASAGWLVLPGRTSRPKRTQCPHDPWGAPDPSCLT